MQLNLKVFTAVGVSAAVLCGASTAAALAGWSNGGAPSPSHRGPAAVQLNAATGGGSAVHPSRGQAPQVGGSGKTITVTIDTPGAAGGFTVPGGATVPKGAGPGAGSSPAGGAVVPAVRTCGGAVILIPCLAVPGAAPPPPPPPEAGAVIVAASRVTLQRELPEPGLAVQPGYAVTGLTAYLEIHTRDDLAFTFAGFRNAVFVTCHWTSFDVDWGDGSPVAGVTSVGGPYPSGDVTHVYQQASPTDDLHVTETWSCPWRDEIGGAGVVIVASDSHLPLEVREIQTLSD